MNNEMNIDIEKLKKQRQQKGWTQQHLADISGLSLRTVQRAESVGRVSVDTISALSSVFVVERSYWTAESFSKKEKQEIINKGWRIALLSIGLAQIISLFLVWLFVGSINSLWLKMILATWLVVGFCYFVVRLTAQQHGLDSYRAFKTMRDKLH
ncbi:hypothetical protein GCM10011365_01580 [Marinicella pacifica]|uniref:HTH cro/C1-type domain-containing protein n=2 Tax=Marinicella pacifica TaxID=1171543 RepID=A0A917CF77_9GAMM|nr:hypothetical protein GCM10011365_01580 [Marinicella pacifica]